MTMAMNGSAKLEEFLTVNEAAEYLGVSPSTLRNWDRAEKLRAQRHPINGYRLYRRRALDRVFKSLKV